MSRKEKLPTPFISVLIDLSSGFVFGRGHGLPSRAVSQLEANFRRF